MAQGNEWLNIPLRHTYTKPCDKKDKCQSWCQTMYLTDILSYKLTVNDGRSKRRQLPMLYLHFEIPLFLIPVKIQFEVLQLRINQIQHCIVFLYF